MGSIRLFALLFSLTISFAQQVETSTIIVQAPTVIVQTTLTSYSPDITTTVIPTTSGSPEYTSPTDLITSVLNSTNFFRYEHNATFLAWNASLASYAANYVQECLWAHSHGGPGENLARGFTDVTSAVDAWGNERDMYDFSTPTGFTEDTGHFTQLVWKSTQTVGCAAYNCAGKNGVEGWYLVCEYWPAGNIVGEGSQVNAWFEANVESEVNEGQGFNVASATAGASGVGTSWASLVGLPRATSSSNSAASQQKVAGWKVEVVGAAAVWLGMLGL